MASEQIPLELAGHVTSVDARNYALATGWQRVEGLNGKLAVYTYPGHELDQLLIPLDHNLDDYGRLMAEVIRKLAAWEKRPAQAVLNDLLLPPADVIRFSLAGPETIRGTVPLERGIDLLAGVRRALLAAACSVIRPQQKFHPRLSRAEPEQLIRSCQLGQTERGSFTATLACPLDAVPTPPSLFGNEPFARQTTALLMRSLHQVVEALDHDQPDKLIQPPPGWAVISSNFCEALVAMQPEGEQSSLRVTATWARTLPPSPQAHLPAAVELPPAYFPVLAQVAQQLRPSHAPQRDLFVGMIDTLNGNPGEDGRMQGEVIVLVLREEALLRARVDLGPEDYSKACDVHKVGGFVILEGILYPGIRLHRIEQVSRFIPLSSLPGPTTNQP
jgi:hypothetical protein